MANIDPNIAALILGAGFVFALFFILIMVLIFVVGPRRKMRQRLSSYDLLGGVVVAGAPAKGAANIRQRRIQEKLQEIEEKKDEKKSRRNQIRIDIIQAGVTISVQQFILISLATGLGTVLIAKLLGAGYVIALLFGLAGGVVLPKLVLRFKAKGRQKKFTQNFANAIDVVVRGIKSGLPVGECLAICGRESPEPVGEEFRHLVEGQKLGLEISELMSRGLERIPTSEYKFFAIVLQIQQQTGGNLAKTLDNLSNVLRERKKMKDKVQSLSSEAKSSAMIIGSLPFFVSAMISLINPDYMALLFTETAGHFMLGGGLAWMSLGIFVMSNMINFEM
jgi:tight adherence protein B